MRKALPVQPWAELGELRSDCCDEQSPYFPRVPREYSVVQCIFSSNTQVMNPEGAITYKQIFYG